MLHYKPRRAIRVRRLLSIPAALVMLLLTVGSAGVVAPSAQAADCTTVNGTSECGYRVSHTFDGTLEWSLIGTFGSISGSNGHRVVCINTGADVPDTLAAPVLKTNAKYAYILAKWVDNTDATYAAAVAHLVKGAMDANPSKRDTFWKELDSDTQDAVEAKAQQMSDQADALAGPYTLTPKITRVGSAAGTVSGWSPKSAAGNYYAGVTMNLTLTNAHFQTAGTATLSLSSLNHDTTLAITADGPGPITFKVATAGNDLPSTQYSFFNAPSGQQDMVSAVFTGLSASASASYDTFFDSPALSSSVGTNYLDSGDAVLTDTVYVTGGTPGGALPVNTTIYGPFSTQPAESASVPDSPVFERLRQVVTLDGGGEASVAFTSSKPVTEPGYYVWRETSEATSSMTVANTDFGRPSETTAVGHPDLTTAISDRTATAGQRVSDKVTLSGLRQVAGGRDSLDAILSGSLLGPLDPIDGSCSALDWSDAPTLLAIEQILLGGDGDVTVGAQQLTRPGCYTYTYTVVGVTVDRTVWTVTQDPGDPAETTLVRKPTLATDVSAQRAMAGSTLSDTVKVTDLADLTDDSGLSVELAGSLLGPVQPTSGSCASADWTGAPVAAVIKPGDVVIAGSDTYKGVGEYTVPKGAAGCYTYTETLTGTSGGNVVWTVEHKPGIAAQTSIVAEPTLVTQTSAQLVGVGQQITDAVTVAGMGGYTGELTATLYGPYAVNPATGCDQVTTQMWDDAVTNGTVKPAGKPETIKIGGDGQITTSPVTLAAAGCYTWGEKLTVDDTDASVTAPLGVAAETTMAISPAITTQAVTTSDTVGGQVSDKITIVGSHGAAGTVTGELRGPVSRTSADDCASVSEEEWASAKVVGTTTVPFTGDQTVETDKLTPNAPGCYTWVQTVTLADPVKFSSSLTAGDPAETVWLKAQIISGLFDDAGGSPTLLVAGGGVLFSLGLVAVGMAMRKPKGRRYAS